MMLELLYYGQNDGTTIPQLAMTGDPGVDNAALTAAGYLSGRIMSIVRGSDTDKGLVIHPCDGASATEAPYGTLLLGAGQFSSSITPSGSGKTPVVRAFAKFNVPSGAYVAGEVFVVGSYLYCADTTNPGTFAGQYTGTPGSGAAGQVKVGICTHKPTTSEPWLGVASML